MHLQDREQKLCHINLQAMKCMASHPERSTSNHPVAFNPERSTTKGTYSNLVIFSFKRSPSGVYPQRSTRKGKKFISPFKRSPSGVHPERSTTNQPVASYFSLNEHQLAVQEREQKFFKPSPSGLHPERSTRY